MATTEDFTQIVRLLNGIQTAGAARAAAGAALRAVSPTYNLLARLPTERAASGRKELDGARVALEQWYRTIEKVSAAAPFNQEWSKGRKLVERCYIVIAGIEAEANHTPQTSNLSILATSIAEAPRVFVSSVGKAAGTVAKEAGSVVGSAAGGILSGLGLSGTVTLLVLALGVLVFVKRGTIFGRLLGGS